MGIVYWSAFKNMSYNVMNDVAYGLLLIDPRLCVV